MTRLLIAIFELIPKNLVSYVVGRLFRLQPRPKIARRLNRLFVRATGIDESESEHPAESYASIGELFARRLRPGVRPISAGMVYPCDGRVTACQQFDNGGTSVVQAKGLVYSLAELIGEPLPFEKGYALTVYLAPHNYHRVHSPLTAQLCSVQHIPGNLWPVNSLLVRHMPNLFCENERLVFRLRHERLGDCFLVMVGAFNVGRMATPFFPDFFTNDKFGMLERKKLEPANPTFLDPGDELGVFLLGSTTVAIFPETYSDSFSFQQVDERMVRMGECFAPPA